MDEIILSELAYESRFSDQRQIESKIKRRLKYCGFRRYRQSRVNLLRLFKNELQTEICRLKKSLYFLGSQGKYADLYDFDVERISRDYSAKFPTISARRVKKFVCFAIFLYWMR